MRRAKLKEVRATSDDASVPGCIGDRPLATPGSPRRLTKLYATLLSPSIARRASACPIRIAVYRCSFASCSLLSMVEEVARCKGLLFKNLALRGRQQRLRSSSQPSIARAFSPCRAPSLLSSFVTLTARLPSEHAWPRQLEQLLRDQHVFASSPLTLELAALLTAVRPHLRPSLARHDAPRARRLALPRALGRPAGLLADVRPRVPG